MFFRRFPIVIAVICAIFLGPRAEGKTISLIRDTEIENTIRAYATPVFEAAGLSADAVRVHLINDNQLNAFVAGGLNLFINTGLLIGAADAGEIIGVIAHETGHIAGGHLVRTQGAMRNATAQTLLAYVLGGVAIAAGEGELGSAIILGGQGVAGRTFLAYSRTQEASADQAAVSLLEKAGQSSTGLQSFLAKLAGQELMSPSQQDPYVRSHPITRDRIGFLNNHVQNSAYSGQAVSPAVQNRHDRLVAKLYAFLFDPHRTLLRYPQTDTSVAARYARSVAHYKRADKDRALAVLDGLLAEFPDDPYFHEFKGQILLEHGLAAPSIPSYRRAVALLPRAEILRTDLARALLATADPKDLPEAIDHLKFAVHLKSEYRSAWQHLGIAYGKSNQMGLSAAALAEEAYLRRNKADANYQIGRAEKDLPTGSPEWLRLQDLKGAVGLMKPATKGKR